MSKPFIASSADQQTWTFVNGNRLVGELTEVACTVPNGAVVEGWATISSHRSSMTKDGVPGMCLVGPVFDTAKRDTVLDSQPIFCRFETE